MSERHPGDGRVSFSGDGRVSFSRWCWFLSGLILGLSFCAFVNCFVGFAAANPNPGHKAVLRMQKNKYAILAPVLAVDLLAYRTAGPEQLLGIQDCTLPDEEHLPSILVCDQTSYAVLSILWRDDVPSKLKGENDEKTVPRRYPFVRDDAEFVRAGLRGSLSSQPEGAARVGEGREGRRHHQPRRLCSRHQKGGCRSWCGCAQGR